MIKNQKRLKKTDTTVIIEKIINFLEGLNRRPFSPALKKALSELLFIEAVRWKHKFLKPKQVCERVYFIVKGLVRAFHFDKNLNERTDWIMKELDVITSVDSFYTREPSDEWLEALEPTIVGSITYEEMESLYDEFPEFDRVGRILNQIYNVMARRRAKELSVLDAREKYEMFTIKYPDLVDRVSVRYIASYIAVEKETLYRIRNGNYNPRRQ